MWVSELESFSGHYASYLSGVVFVYGKLAGKILGLGSPDAELGSYSLTCSCRFAPQDTGSSPYRRRTPVIFGCR